jgi:hypothetical protein
VAHSGVVHVQAEMCSTCIFRPGNLMNLKPGRVKEMVEGSLADEAGITCHKTIYGQAAQEAVCAGFYDRYAHRVTTFQIAERLGAIKRIESQDP